MEARARSLPELLQSTSTSNSTSYSSIFFYVVVSFMIAVVIGLIVYLVVSRVNTVPFSTSGEGFQGPTQGVSDLKCGQESSEAVGLAEMFASKQSSTEDGPYDLLELKLILSKLCCMKHDLVSVSQVIQATHYLPFSTSHDLQSPADTVARCFTKSIPPRDLDLAFGSWKQRAVLLIRRLCTSYNLSESESEKAKSLFNAVWSDVLSIAKNACSPPAEEVIDSPRTINGFISEKIKDLGTYTGYY